MEHAAGISVAYEGGDRLRIAVRGHDLVTDQPIDSGGDDREPTPTELFVGSLVSCMGFYAQRFLRLNHVEAAGLALSATFESTAERPYRVSAISVDVVLPPGTPDRLVDPLRRVMDACTVHNTLRHEPSVTLTLEQPEIGKLAG